MGPTTLAITAAVDRRLSTLGKFKVEYYVL